MLDGSELFKTVRKAQFIEAFNEREKKVRHAYRQKAQAWVDAEPRRFALLESLGADAESIYQLLAASFWQQDRVKF